MPTSPDDATPNTRVAAASHRIPLSVIVVTWNGCALLRNMLESLYVDASAAEVSIEVIVVDNGSEDDTLETLAREFPLVKTVPLDSNVGFAKANNIGVGQSSGKLVLLLNNDLVIQAGFVRAILAGAERYPTASIFATQMLTVANPERVDNRGIYLAWTGHYRQRDSGRLRHPERAAGLAYGASGGAMCVRRSFLTRHGLFNEAYVTYLEDADFALRARNAGARCVYLPDAVVLHHGSATADRLPDWKFFQIQRNQAMLRRETRHGLTRKALIVPQSLYVTARALIALRGGRLLPMLRAIRDARSATRNIGGFAPSEP